MQKSGQITREQFQQEWARRQAMSQAQPQPQQQPQQPQPQPAQQPQPQQPQPQQQPDVKGRRPGDTLKSTDALRKHNEMVQSLYKKHGLTKAEQRQVHDEIMKQNYTRDEIEQIITTMIKRLR